MCSWLVYIVICYCFLKCCFISVWKWLNNLKLLCLDNFVEWWFVFSCISNSMMLCVSYFSISVWLVCGVVDLVINSCSSVFMCLCNFGMCFSLMVIGCRNKGENNLLCFLLLLVENIMCGFIVSMNFMVCFEKLKLCIREGWMVMIIGLLIF